MNNQATRRSLNTRQAGMSAIGLIFLLLIIGFVTLITLRLLPMYLENFSVATALESLKNEPELAIKSAPEILSLLQKRLDVNNVDNVKRNNIGIKRNDASVTVSIKYEVRKPLIANLDVVSKFDRSIEVRQR